MFLLDISKENSKGKPHTDNTDSIFAWSGVRWGGWLYSLYDIPSFCVYCSWASFSYLLIFTWRKSWFRFVNTRSGRNQCAPATSGLDLPSRKDCTPHIMELLLITTCVLSILQCTCKYQEPRTPHPQAMITRKKNGNKTH